MAKNGDQDSPREYCEQQFDQPGDADGFLQSSVNGGGIPQLTPLNFGQRGASNSMDQGREQPQTLMQQQPDTSRGKKRNQQQSAPDSHSPEIRQTLPEKLVRKRESDKRYRDKIRREKQQTKADLENLRTENGQLKDEYWELKSEVKKLKAENGQLRQECQEMKSYVAKLEAEAHGSGPPQSSTSGFQHVGPSVQPSNINPFDDWSHNWDNGVDEHFTVEEICIRSPKMLENEDRQLMPQPFSIAPINMPKDGFQNEDMQLNRSHEVLENEDMQFMPQPFSMEGNASMNMPKDCYTFYIPSPISRSHEMFENEDMQLMSLLLSVEGQASINMPEDGYTSPPYIPSPMPNFDEDRSRPGKAVVGFLKIKAAMRWGIFIRKKAAERRTQIVELEEEE